MKAQMILGLTIPGSAQYLGVARRALNCIAAKTSLTSQQVGELKLAVGEACANAVRYCRPKNSPVALKCIVDSDRIEVLISNRGASFKLNGWHKAKCPPPSAEGGRGMFLINNTVDEWDAKCHSGRTVVRLVKRFHTAN